jgi:hypothetical protein
VDGAGNTLSTLNSGTVTLTKTAGTFSPPGGAFTYTSPTFVNGVATFTDLQSTGTGSGFKLRASSAGFQNSPDSGEFLIASGEPCTTSGCPPFTTMLGPSQVTSSGTGNTFTFLAVLPSSIPGSVIDPTSALAGCRYYMPAGGAFQAIDGRTSASGTLFFTYFLSKSALDKLYGSTSGQQFVPLCAGAAWVDGSGNVKKCTDLGAPAAWVGKELIPDPVTGVGKFDGHLRRAVCDPPTGLFWGILASFQDYNHTDTVNSYGEAGLTVDPTRDPTVTGWGSGGSFRNFNVQVPSPLDWKMG